MLRALLTTRSSWVDVVHGTDMNKKENLRFDNTEDDIRMSSKNHEGNGHIMHADSDLLNIFWHCFQVLYPPR